MTVLSFACEILRRAMTLNAPTETEKAIAAAKYETARRQAAQTDRLLAYETRRALAPLAAALLQAEQDDGAEPLDTEQTCEIPEAEREECPPTQRAGALYPITLPNFADAVAVA